MGHDWLVVHGSDSLLAVEVTYGNLLNAVYRKSSIPKVYRGTYRQQEDLYSFTEDVTRAYKSPVRAAVPIRRGTEEEAEAYLAVFDQSNGWVPIARAEATTKGSVVFPDIGAHIVYLAGYYGSERQFRPLNDPFIPDGQGQLQYLRLDTTARIDSAMLTRKYPPYFIRTGRKKLQRILNVNALRLQASTDSGFTAPQQLLQIRNFGSTQPQSLPLEEKGTWKYYRLKGPDSLGVRLAELGLRSDRPYKMSAQHPHRGLNNLENLDDQDPLTYWGNRGFEVRFTFETPARVSALTLQANNDDNDINIGDTYELLYWDQHWQSLGTQTANDTVLVYKDVPANILYWLRNHSRGREEHVFTLTDESNQWWPGVSRYQ